MKLNDLCSISQIIRKPLVLRATNSQYCKFIQQQTMVYSIKCFSQIDKHSSCQLTLIYASTNSISKAESCKLIRMTFTKTSLIRTQNIVLLQVLPMYGPFQNFGKHGKYRNRTVVIHILSIYSFSLIAGAVVKINLRMKLLVSNRFKGSVPTIIPCACKV